LAAGDRDGVVEAVFRELELVSDADIEAFKAAPSWPGRVAAAHTIIREVRAETTVRLDPELAARISVPVLLVTGQHSSDPCKADIEAVAAALPDARIVVIEGQGHVADVLIPEVFADHLLGFLGDQR
jgi:pimeloyl-ACP methyl ester carboxylesterase